MQALDSVVSEVKMLALVTKLEVKIKAEKAKNETLVHVIDVKDKMIAKLLGIVKEMNVEEREERDNKIIQLESKINEKD